MVQTDWIGVDDSAVDRPRLPVQKRRAARRDPSTSHTAARKLNKSGVLRPQQAEVIALVKAHPGLTAVELAHHSGHDNPAAYRYVIARRLPEVSPFYVRPGKQRLDIHTGNVATTWWPVERGDA